MSYSHLQLNLYVFDVAPILLVVISITLYTPPTLMIKLQLMLSCVRLEHLSHIEAGPSTFTVTVSVGGVYTDDD